MWVTKSKKNGCDVEEHHDGCDVEKKNDQAKC